jgi:hypothetical protein
LPIARHAEMLLSQFYALPVSLSITLVHIKRLGIAFTGRTITLPNTRTTKHYKILGKINKWHYLSITTEMAPPYKLTENHEAIQNLLV